MGALLAKPVASSFRVWDLTPFSTIDYLNNLNKTPIKVYLFGNKPVRILPSTTWISDKVRFSFDGWLRQRLTHCYSNGRAISWAAALSIFFNRVVNKRVALHWSSVESGLILSFINSLSKISELNLPYTNYTGSSSSVRESIQNADSYRWSLRESYPTFVADSSSFLYKSLDQNKSKTNCSILQPILTSSEETELSPVPGGYIDLKSDVTCLVQTESITALNFIYLGTHGYVNAQRASLAIPLLMPFERSNEVTGSYFMKGPVNSRSLLSLSFVVAQIFSNYFSPRSTRFVKIKKPYSTLDKIVDVKILSFTSNRNKFLSFFRQPPQYEVSPLVQILNEFIQHE